ncbi:MAG: hypothetical protein GTN99_03100, partial [Candidatus Dadabacteria bacterium]|nr:hypothetical protein [Candidatus Dadabacteria bacterium]
MIPFLLTTIVIFTSFYLLLTYVKLIPVSEKLISAVVLTSAQIIAVEILLGTAGMLSLVYIVPINLILSVALFSFVFYRQRNVVYHFLNDFYVLFNFIKALKSPYILFLFALLIFVCIWLFFAAVLLPPRGIDDLTYHLPPLYEFIQQQRIFLLPVEYRGHFAFPMNAELLFLWPLLFFHGIDPIGMVQFSYGILGILIVYSLSRQLSIKPQVSVFTGLVFFFTPVV